MAALPSLLKWLASILKKPEPETAPRGYGQFVEFDALYAGLEERRNVSSRTVVSFAAFATDHQCCPTCAEEHQQDFTLETHSEAVAIDLSHAIECNNRGVIHRREYALEAAVADFTLAIELYPNYAVAYNNRGFAYRAMGDLDAAIADYSKAIEILPTYYVAYGNRSNAYGEKGDLDRAIADCDKVIELVPVDAMAYYNRGISYQSKNDNQAACADFWKAAEIFSQQKDTINYQKAVKHLEDLYS